MEIKHLLTLLILLFTAISTHALEFSVNGIYYYSSSATSTTCAVTYKTNVTTTVYKGDMVIPETVSYGGQTYTVTEIKSWAFQNCAALESISLPSSITSIGQNAFENCVLLKSISIPENCEEIGSSAFSGCSSLSGLNLGNVKSIGSYCFKDCSGLKDVIVPSSVTSVSSYAFAYCYLNLLKLEDGTDEISFETDYLTVDSMYIGRNIKDKSGKDFETSVRSVYFSDAVTRIPNYCFYPYNASYSKLEGVYGMKNVTSIGEYAFYTCTMLKRFVIGNNVTTIGYGAFQGCTALETLVVGDGVTAMKVNNVLGGCKNLKTLYLGKGITELSLGTSTSTPSWTANSIYLFSDVLATDMHYTRTGTSTSGNTYTTNYYIVPASATIYVISPERYETILDGYNVKSLLTFNETSVEYTGRTPELTYKNNVEGMGVSFDSSTTPKDAGSYNTELDVTFSMSDWQTTVQIPCAYTVAKAPLSIMTNNAQRYYGEDNPELTCEYVGFKNGETAEVLDAQPTVYTTATKDSYVGTYPIYCTGAEAKNYTITTQNGTLTIIKAPQTITWEQDFTGVHVGDQIELTATASSSLNVKYRSSDQTAVLITTQNGKQYAYILKEGIAAITAYQSGDTNHEEADEVTLLVNATSDISGIQVDTDPNATYYNTSGQRVSQPNGLTIVRQADGTIRKVVVK